MDDKEKSQDEHEDQIELKDLTAINDTINSYSEEPGENEALLNESPIKLEETTEVNQPDDNQHLASELLSPLDQYEIESQVLNTMNQNNNANTRQKSIFEKLEDLKETKPTLFYCLLLAFLLGLSIIGSVIMTYKTIEYSNIALTRNKLTGSLYDKTYMHGYHFLMPWKEFILFDATVHTFKFKELRLLTTDQLQVRITIVIHYFLEPQELSKLYRIFGNDYENVTRNVAKSTIINEAQVFSIRDFRVNRLSISRILQSKLEPVLKQNHLRMTNFFLHGIKFTKLINDRNLFRVLNGIYNEKAQYVKDALLYIKNTEAITQKIKVDAKYTTEIANQRAEFDLVKRSQINYERKTEIVQVDSLKETFEKLNITQSKNQSQTNQYFLSFCYFDMLAKKQNIVLMANNFNNIKLI